ncbi:MAG: putative ABC exporter domain-containing protein [Clostridia bacterium]|nr:putative ABC exporter domain-containing protein [Clostridia bacterium]
MKLFLYYTLHSFKNQLKKLFKTWVLIFVIACMLIGGIIGGVIGFLSEEFDEPSIEEPLPDEEIEEFPELNPEEIKLGIDGITSIIIIVLLLLNFIAADKNGSLIFTMPDVNLLFQAPMRPQSVLLFKLTTQILITALSFIYIVFQVPLLAVSLGLGAFCAVAIILAFIVLFVYGKLINVFIYTLASTKENLKKYIRPAAIVIALITVLPIALEYADGKEIWDATLTHLSRSFTLYIPIFGWIKGMVVYAVEGKYLLSVLSFLISALGIAAAIFGIWRMKADFYEDAMAKSEETAAVTAAVNDGVNVKRNKDRAEKIKRDGLNFGSGANMFFCKAFYNRLRFSYLKVFTKTSIFYLVLATGLALVLRFAAGIDNFIIVGITISALVFFRSLGNPLAHDMEKPYLLTVPSSAHEKVFFSLMGGTLDTALDTLPSLIISGIVMSSKAWLILGFWILAVTVDFYANNVMLFIELSLPSSLNNQIKQMIVVMFIYFGLIPRLAVALVSYLLFESIAAAVVFSAVGALLISLIFFAFSPLFLSRGRK